MTDQTTMYAVSVRVDVERDEIWSATIDLPTFFLMADVQGITSEEHACSIARRMFSSLGHAESDIHVCAVETSAVTRGSAHPAPKTGHRFPVGTRVLERAYPKYGRGVVTGHSPDGWTYVKWDQTGGRTLSHNPTELEATDD